MKKKLHILFLCSWFPSRVKPTSGDFVFRHAKAVATKHKVTVIHVISDKNLHSKIELDFSNINNIQIIIGYIPKTWNPLLKFYYFIKAYSKILSNVNLFDMVHLNVTYPKGIVALYLKWFKKKPFIISEHWTDYQSPMNKSIGFIRKKITQLIAKNATFICPVSRAHQKDMLAFGLKGSYKVVPNVINTRLFFPIKQKNAKFIITHISTLNNKQKNIKGLLKVIKKLSDKRSDFIFKLIGNGGLEDVKNIISDLQFPKNIIQLEGSKSHKEIAKILQESNLYISFSNYESFGIVMTEAIATATPVISTATGILAELNIPEYATIIPINDQNKLLKKIILYMETQHSFDAKKMNQFIENNFGIDKVCKSFTKLYLQSLNQKF